MSSGAAGLPDWLEPLPAAAAMRALDRWAIEDQGVPGAELMERAGEGLAAAAAEIAAPGPVRVLCGKGNNGGDGLVAARHLLGLGYEVEVLLLAEPADLRGDAALNLERLPSAPSAPAPADLPAALAGSGAVIDALLGTGFSGVPRGRIAEAIAAINTCDAPVVSADIASGVDASTGRICAAPGAEREEAAVRADLTVSFHAAKPGHWIDPGKRHTGRLRVVPIGMPAAGAPPGAAGSAGESGVSAPGGSGPGAGSQDPLALDEMEAGLIGERVLELAPRRSARSTKFGSGQVVVAGGSRGLTGAVCMAAQAAIRSGAGYVTAAVPASLEPIFEQKLTEVMTVGCPDRDGHLAGESAEPVREAWSRAAAAVIGPGLGRDPESLELARALALEAPAPLVLDADGLNAFAGRIAELAGRRAPAVLTPHAGELGRLLGVASAEVSARRLEHAVRAARAARAVLVLKGDDTIVTDGERVAINALSAPALATAGTGDVLTGVVAALLARGMEPFAAACAAVLAHARAGRAAAERLGRAESVIATDVIDSLPQGLRPDAAPSAADRL